MDSELPGISEHADPADKLRYYRESKGLSQELLDEYTRFYKPGYGKRICSIRKAYGLIQVKFAELVGTGRRELI